MTDEEINRVIDEFLGWEKCKRCDDKDCAYNQNKDYCNDLNKIAEAETHLSEEQLFRMNQRIWDATMNTKYVWQLTARQRAMALIEAVDSSAKEAK